MQYMPFLCSCFLFTLHIGISYIDGKGSMQIKGKMNSYSINIKLCV